MRLYYEIDRSSKLNYLTFFFFSVGTSAIAAGVSTALTSAATITTIFGVGGAGENYSTALHLAHRC